jgi:DNA replication protein DnaC
MAVVNQCIESGIDAVYTTFADLEGFVRAAFDEKRQDEFGTARQRIARLSEVCVLAIDEFDKVKVTAWLDELRFDLLDKRYRSAIARETGTLLAMNCDPRGLPEWIASRLYDGRNVVVHNTDSDMRSMMK